MTTARDIMTSGAQYLKDDQTARGAAERLAVSDIGAVPVCDTSGHLVGMVTDRDIVVGVIAQGKDAGRTPLSDLTRSNGNVVTIGADDSVEEAIETMKRNQVRRLPVIDGSEVVGIVSQADVARSLSPEKVGELFSAISA